MRLVLPRPAPNRSAPSQTAPSGTPFALRQFALRPFTLLAFALTGLPACTDKASDIGRTFDSDTAGVCGRVRGSSGILLYESGGDELHVPTEAPSTTAKTTGIAGPVGDATTMVGVTAGMVMVSTNTGCDWEQTGSLPSTGDWALVAGNMDVYAFDRLSGAGAVSADLGASWTPFDTVEPFVDPPTFASGRLRGVQGRGVVSSEDRGATWTLTGAAPFIPNGGNVSPTNLDLVTVAGPTGIFISHTGGASWDDISAKLVGHADGTVIGLRVAASPANDDVLFAIGDGADGTRTFQRSIDAGANWDRLGDSTQVTIGDDARLYPMPDDATMVISASGVPADNKMNLYRITAGEGLHTVGVGGYLAMPQLSLQPERWVAAVHAVP